MERQWVGVICNCMYDNEEENALIVLGKKRQSILASCMANLSKFHVVFSSSTFMRLNKDAFEGHLCYTVNNCFSIFHRTPT